MKRQIKQRAFDEETMDFGKENEGIFLDRTINLVGPILPIKTSTRFYNQLQYLLEESKELPIYIYINSPGGDLDGALNIVDMIEAAKDFVNVITICGGEAQSGAALVFAAGTYGYRTALPSSVFMFHDVHVMMGGEHKSFHAAVENTIKQRNRYLEALAFHLWKQPSKKNKNPYSVAEKCKGSLANNIKKVTKMIEKDTYFSALEGEDMGFIDYVGFPIQQVSPHVKELMLGGLEDDDETTDELCQNDHERDN